MTARVSQHGELWEKQTQEHKHTNIPSFFVSQYVVAVVCSPAPFFCMMMQVTAAHTHGSGMVSTP